MNRDKIEKAVSRLDSAIRKIDVLLQKYSFVVTMDLAKQARLELEFASRLLNQELKDEYDKSVEVDTTGNDSKGDVQLDETGNQVNEPDGSISKGNEVVS